MFLLFFVTVNSAEKPFIRNDNKLITSHTPPEMKVIQITPNSLEKTKHSSSQYQIPIGKLLVTQKEFLEIRAELIEIRPLSLV
ncbi:hypothetical protein [Bacillus sp. Bos-x628]|uniref:hypothetical protein n=1 Tax=Bacillus maqinnsis TaxID=3229854 RepID=UPI00339018B5